MFEANADLYCLLNNAADEIKILVLFLLHRIITVHIKRYDPLDVMPN